MEVTNGRCPCGCQDIAVFVSWLGVRCREVSPTDFRNVFLSEIHRAKGRQSTMQMFFYDVDTGKSLDFVRIREIFTSVLE